MSDNSGQQPGAFESAVAQTDAAMLIATVAAGDQRAGCLVGFATQVSIHPARFLVCLSKNNHTYQVSRHARHLAVHLIGHTSIALARLFGSETGDEIDKFRHCRWRPGPNGEPVLEDAAAWFSGPILHRHDLGDHVAVLIAPEAGFAPRERIDLVRYHDVADLHPGHQA